MQVKGTGARGAVIGAKSGGAIFQTRMEEVWQWWAVGKNSKQYNLQIKDIILLSLIQLKE